MPKYGIGQPVRRLEDRRFLIGAGQFVDDISLPNQCYGVVLYSPYAHAKITRIDASHGQFLSPIGSAVLATALPSWSPKHWHRQPTR
jgi:carbon-monoxide dehydrogenase large subunit